MSDQLREVWVLEYNLPCNGESWIVDKAFERASAAYRTLERLRLGTVVEEQQFRVIRYVPDETK